MFQKGLIHQLCRKKENEDRSKQFYGKRNDDDSLQHQKYFPQLFIIRKITGRDLVFVSACSFEKISEIVGKGQDAQSADLNQ